MRRILVVLAAAAGILVAIVLLTGGGGGGNDEKQVRATLTGYTQASAQHDYATICKRYLAPSLLERLRQIRLRCTAALARSALGTLRSPTLTVKRVRVTGATALADVHTGAADQAPLDGTIELIKISGLWQIRSQAEKTKP